MEHKPLLHSIRPIRVLPLGFLGVILVGTLLLMLPAASKSGTSLPFLSALFTATSASCVTGLVVVDTGTYFTLFGQIVILLLIQIGGLGFMTAATILFILLRKRISLRERLTIAESFGESHLQGIVRLGINAVMVTFAFELAGAALFCTRFVPQFGVAKGIWYSVFHSISAFCNAGFDLMGGYRSFTDYAGDVLVNLTLMGLIVAGGLGYSVILNIGRARRFRRMRLHTKIVLSGTLFLIVTGALLVFLMESGNEKTLGALPPGERVMASFFQSITLRTAGFNTIDQYSLRDATKMFGVVLMLIGGAPAGTAGGLKITTFVVMALAVRAQTHGKKDITAFGRRLPPETSRRALCILTIGLSVVVVAVMALSLMENGTAAGRLGFINQLYDTASALGTVGVSSGVTVASGAGTRALLILIMYIGRVGMLTLALSLTRGKSEEVVRFPEEEIMVG